MGSLVFKKFIFVDKDLPTVTALIRPFSCVNFPMVNKTGALSKELPAVTAQIRFFSSVNSPVLREFVLLPEGFATFAALVMALPRVGGLSPLPASAWMLSIVGRMVLEKAQAAEESLLNFSAPERRVSQVENVSLYQGTHTGGESLQDRRVWLWASVLCHLLYRDTLFGNGLLSFSSLPTT